MNKKIEPKLPDYIGDIQQTQQLCTMLMKTAHYSKIGSAGIFAIVEKAKSIGINPVDALNGGMFFVQGKVELTAAMMNHLIRAGGHSITKDKKSDDSICILHGRRADTGDTWVESFSIDEAKRAQIYRNQWLKYPRDMLFARALSRLARQLFPDVIKGCYVQDEVMDEPVDETVPDETAEQIEEYITADEATYLSDLIGPDEEYRKCVMTFLSKNYGLSDLEGMPRVVYDKILPVAKEKREKRESATEVTDESE